MVYNPPTEDDEPTQTDADRAFRTVIAGSPQGSVRRIILYLVIAAALAFGQPIIIGATGLVALLLLALTDQLV